MELGTFAWAMQTIADDPCVGVYRDKRNEDGSPAWRRRIFNSPRSLLGPGIWTLWPSYRTTPYTPSQEDMIANDWKVERLR